MSEPTLDDLRVPGYNEYGHFDRRLTPAEFDRIAREQGYVKETALVKRALDIFYEGGWVKRPVCGECEGGKQSSYLGGGPVEEWPCPSCGGTGFGRLVALDGIDVEALRDVMANHERLFNSPSINDWCVLGDTAEIVLAAIDGGQDDPRCDCNAVSDLCSPNCASWGGQG